MPPKSPRRRICTIAGGATRLKVSGGVPPKCIFSEFFWLFESRDTGVLSDPSFEATMALRGTRGISYERFMQHKPEFESYEDFIEHLEGMLR